MKMMSPQRPHARPASETQAWDLCRQGRDLLWRGQAVQGVACMQRAAHLAPDNPYIQLNTLTHLHYLPEITRQDLYQGFVSWAQRFVPFAGTTGDYHCSRDPDRRLRIGYISPDFYQHSVAFTFEPILDALDRRDLEVYGYGNVETPDSFTTRLSGKFEMYRDIHGLPLEDIVNRIWDDHIDILVALAGYTAGHCLEILGCKPAPIQVDMGGLCTTGLQQIDYRLTDELYDPRDTQPYYVERLVYLPGGLSVFRPPALSPTIAPLPALSGHGLTFGAFNFCGKITDVTLDLWAQVLQRLPAAHLVLKFKQGDDPALQTYYIQALETRGIARHRVEIMGTLPYGEHLDLFNRIDLLLDTSPYNGGVTTLEGLWMGVPTLTLTGQTFVSRAGLSILSRVGLDMFCSTRIDEVVNKAVAFAGQLSELNQIRLGLRARMLSSPLCDPGRMSRELTRAYRWMWQRYCEQEQTS